MDIFSIFTLCGGLAFFLYGMNTMSKSLEKMAGGKLERTIKRMTSSAWKSLLLGAGITIAIQSSSAVTVMLVGLVNSGVMELGQTIGIIMGSNIGTTLTAWILSMAGIESGNFFIRILKPESFSPLLALLGMILIMASKKQRKQDIGSILMGFSVLMYGMELMKDSVSPLANMPEFESMLIAFNNPLLGVLVGAVFTGVIQSSAASVGILQALALTGSITYSMAVPIIMGQNIGTCVTAVISSIGVNRNAKRVAAVHISFNVIGTVACLILFYGGNTLFHFPFMDQTIGAVGIAFCHTVFNIITTALLLPFARQLEKLACAIVHNADQKKKGYAFLDPLLLRTPAIALNECASLTHKMARLAEENLNLAIQQIENYSESRAETIKDHESKLDIAEDRLNSYLVDLSQHSMSHQDMRTVSMLLHVIGDLERIGDHAWNIQNDAKELYERGMAFSDAANKELSVLSTALRDTVRQTIDCFCRTDAEAALYVEPLEETIDHLVQKVSQRHIDRLQSGRCTIQLGFILHDLLEDIERVGDHCSNIAVSILEAAGETADSHIYLRKMKADSTFARKFQNDLEHYQLPEA